MVAKASPHSNLMIPDLLYCCTLDDDTLVCTDLVFSKGLYTRGLSYMCLVGLRDVKNSRSTEEFSTTRHTVETRSNCSLGGKMITFYAHFLARTIRVAANSSSLTKYLPNICYTVTKNILGLLFHRIFFHYITSPFK